MQRSRPLSPLAFADNDGELLSRLRLLGLDAGVIAAGAIVGYLCRGSAAVLWPVFVAITFTVGMAARQTGDDVADGPPSLVHLHIHFDGGRACAETISEGQPALGCPA